MAKRSVTVPDGFVYFIRSGNSQRVKIGWAKDPYKRVSELQTGSALSLHLIGYIPGARVDEQDWHWQWKDCRHRGEWFDLNNALREAINMALFQPTSTRYLHVKLNWREVAA